MLGAGINQDDTLHSVKQEKQKQGRSEHGVWRYGMSIEPSDVHTASPVTVQLLQNSIAITIERPQTVDITMDMDHRCTIVGVEISKVMAEQLVIQLFDMLMEQ